MIYPLPPPPTNKFWTSTPFLPPLISYLLTLKILHVSLYNVYVQEDFKPWEEYNLLSVMAWQIYRVPKLFWWWHLLTILFFNYSISCTTLMSLMILNTRICIGGLNCISLSTAYFMHCLKHFQHLQRNFFLIIHQMGRTHDTCRILTFASGSGVLEGGGGR